MDKLFATIDLVKTGDLGAFPQGVELFLKRGVSVFRSCYDTEPFTATEATDVLKAISGVSPLPEWAKGWQEKVERLRACKDAEKQKVIKQSLPAITWSGVFSKRANAALVKHSGLICIDLDNIGGRDKLDVVLEGLRKSPFLWAAFTSPRGTGLKAIFCIRRDAATHHRCYLAMRDYVRELTGITCDDVKDVARLCYASSDRRAILLER